MAPPRELRLYKYIVPIITRDLNLLYKCVLETKMDMYIFVKKKMEKRNAQRKFWNPTIVYNA